MGIKVKDYHKFKNSNHEKDIKNNQECMNQAENVEDISGEILDGKETLQELNEKLQQKTNEAKDYFDRLQRIAAEFDNYKKRTAKEKEMIYNDAVIDIISGFLPLLDNFERALFLCGGEETSGIVEGVKMIEKQFKELLQKHGITEIEAVNHNFDPELHEAVIHIQDDNYGEGVVIEEMRKGYKCGERVLRHSMVKVAN